MRRARPAALAVMLAAALLGLLTGCTTPLAPGHAVDLLRKVWHVHDAAGGDGTYLLFTDGDLRVQIPGGSLALSWMTQGTAMLVRAEGEPSASQSVARAVDDWLGDVSSFGRSGPGWVLLDASGNTLATLRDDGPPPPSRFVLMTPDPVTAFDRDRVADAVAGAGVRTSPSAAALAGRWGVPGLDPVGAELMLSATGAWKAVGDCREGTGNGSSGVLRLVPHGFLLQAADPMSDVGCAARGVPAPPPDAAALVRFYDARSVALSGDHLTLFDQTGHRIGTLTRLR